MHNVDLKSGIRWFCAVNRKRLCPLPILLSVLFASTSCLANGGSKQAHAVIPAQKLQNTLWWRIAKQHQLDPYILYAVALKESANDADPASVKPWPWALNKSGKALMPASRREAQALLKQSLDEGNRLIDVGLMQINLRWHGHRVSTPAQLLDPMTNVQIGAELLTTAIRSAPHDLALGIGRYYSWNNVEAAVAYGQSVMAIADHVRQVI
ncbi:transglycosylase SLT domain-containing protein [Methylomonas sp. LL1]|uniref:transglycosylase SLT domain-containing protein n=1 Tax=Methylomonas sp. LL1 TaxID=2785785 RepID=UPI0018C35AA7|nr:transglycosylase SLT domain-containing protein [Methylomonas sp. LL1]QPK64120.1 transglycosylase SLT domain-containing protein [Methylomonas sp. LL1]